KATGALAARARTGKVRISNSPVIVGNLVLVINDVGKINAFRMTPMEGKRRAAPPPEAPAKLEGAVSEPQPPAAVPAPQATPGAVPPTPESAPTTPEPAAPQPESSPTPESVPPQPESPQPTESPAPPPPESPSPPPPESPSPPPE